MEQEKALLAAKELLVKTQLINLATVDTTGAPEVRMMLNGGTEGLDLWMITNASSSKMEHIGNDPRVCIFAADAEKLRGLKVCGEMEVIEDMAVKEKVWKEEWRQWYADGPADSEFVLMKLHAKRFVYSDGMDYTNGEL
ncbi:MAG: pyridoxamine 5'-phosphate oxidase family protein [Patescibacteria group bacterium]